MSAAAGRRGRLRSAFGLPRGALRRASILLLAAFFVAAGVNHFANTPFYLSIMPLYLPVHLELVYLSGVFEILGGLGILLARARWLAGWGLVALLLAVYPANIHMAVEPEPFVAEGMPRWALVLRLPLQFVLIGWVYWATRPLPEPERADRPV